MASKCGRIINRASISSLKSSFKKSSSSSSSSFSSPSASRSVPTSFSQFSKPTSSPVRRFSFSRIPSELGCVQSMMPLHNAVATARMTSYLSSTSRSCRALSQAGPVRTKVTSIADQSQ